MAMVIIYVREKCMAMDIMRPVDILLAPDRKKHLTHHQNIKQISK